MNIHKILLSFGMLGVLGAAVASAAVPASRTAVTPGTINYQGRLTDPDGEPYTNGVYTIEFRLYDAATGSSSGLWGCAYSAYVKDGYFNVMLGATGGSALSNAPTYGPTELWKALWYDSAAPAKANDRYLGLKVLSGPDPALPDPPVEAFPRQRLLSAPFAERAQMANYARAAIDTFTIGLAREVAAEGIRVNAVRPGLIETDIHASGGLPDRVRDLAHLVPMQRGGTEDAAMADAPAFRRAPAAEVAQV